MRKLLTLITAVLCSGTVLAKDTTIFSCTATNGKSITVKKIGNDYQFNYDKVSFKNPAKQVLANKDSYVAPGSGFISYSLELKNKGISYVIGFVQPRVGNVNEFIEPGISVGSKFIECNSKKPVLQKFEVSLMKGLI